MWYKLSAYCGYISQATHERKEKRRKKTNCSFFMLLARAHRFNHTSSRPLSSREFACHQSDKKPLVPPDPPVGSKPEHNCTPHLFFPVSEQEDLIWKDVTDGWGNLEQVITLSEHIRTCSLDCSDTWRDYIWHLTFDTLLCLYYRCAELASDLYTCSSLFFYCHVDGVVWTKLHTTQPTIDMFFALRKGDTCGR